MADWLQLTGHSSPRDAGITARDAGVKKHVLTHIDRDSKYGEVGVLGEASEVYDGEVRMAHDLMTIGVNSHPA